MQTKYKILFWITPSVLLLDQLTKLAVERWIAFGTRIPVIPGTFDLVHYHNTGAAFGMFSGLSAAIRTPFFYVVAGIAVVLLAFLYRGIGERERLMPVALSLVFGGIAGNIIDRIRVGSVIDYLSFHLGDAVASGSFLRWTYEIPLEWPAFNVADSAITAAMVLILIATFRYEQSRDGR